jgi:hypothetical protein
VKIILLNLPIILPISSGGEAVSWWASAALHGRNAGFTPDDEEQDQDLSPWGMECRLRVMLRARRLGCVGYE